MRGSITSLVLLLAFASYAVARPTRNIMTAGDLCDPTGTFDCGTGNFCQVTDAGVDPTVGTCVACTCGGAQYTSVACSGTSSTNDATCVNCSTIDADCDQCTDATHCTSCAATYFRASDTSCDTCDGVATGVAPCAAGTYLSTTACDGDTTTDVSSCAPCTPIANCATGSLSCTSGASSTCSACNTGYYLSNNQCVQCGSSNCGASTYYDEELCGGSNSGCIACNTITDDCDACGLVEDVPTCTSCAADFFLGVNGDGKQVCSGCSDACDAVAMPEDHGFFYVEGQCGNGESELPNSLTHVNGHNSTRTEVGDSGCYSCTSAWCANGWRYIEDACGHDYTEEPVATLIAGLVDSGLNNGCFKCAPIHGCKEVRCAYGEFHDHNDQPELLKFTTYLNTTAVDAAEATYAVQSWCEVPHAGWEAVNPKPLVYYDEVEQEYVAWTTKPISARCNKKANKNCIIPVY